jgi:hypothetical protein
MFGRLRGPEFNFAAFRNASLTIYSDGAFEDDEFI